MSLGVSDLAQLSELLDAALDLPAEKQQEWLARLEPKYQAWRPTLEKLLGERSDSETQDVLSNLPQWVAAHAAQRLAAHDLLQGGQTVGPYRLVRPLGRGGMGAVWLAERVDKTVKRTVALKLPYMGPQHLQLAERYERERDILATLEHRHIARLYDAGVSLDGQPYLALEHVTGVPITAHCDSAQLTTRERVELFLQVLQAVQYAHSRLVIHRDLKPSNIFVTPEGQVQLLDFGIATLLAEDGPSKCAITEFGAAALTPDYASPEQVAGRPIGTGSDIYSLGVVFYELLTGQRPYRLARESRGALEEAILNSDLVRPSAKVTDENTAALRSTTLKLLRRQLRGDLDTIAMAALKKSETDRYASTESFQLDLQRWLDCEPVHAHPDSFSYRVRKFARRNQLTVGAAFVTGAAVLAGLSVALFQTGVATEQSVLAQREARKATAVQEFLVGLFNAADPARAQGREVTVRDLMIRGERDLHTKLAAEPELNEAISAALVEIYLKLADEKRALPLAQARHDVALRTHGPHSVEYGDALMSLGKVLGRVSQHEKAVEALSQARVVFEAHPGKRQGQLLTIPQYLSYSLTSMSKAAQARELLLRTLPAVEKYFGPTSWEVVKQKSAVAVTYAYEGDHGRATSLYSELEPLLDLTGQEADLAAADLRGDIGFSYYLMGQWQMAARSLQHQIEQYDDLVSPRNTSSIAALVLLGSVHTAAGNYVRAAEVFRASTKRSVEFQGAEGDVTVKARSASIPALLWLGRSAEAEQIGRETVAAGTQSKTLGEMDRRQIKRMLALALIFVGKSNEAAGILQQMSTQEMVDGDTRHAATLLYLAGAFAAQGRHGDAAEAANQAGNMWAQQGATIFRTMMAKARLTEALALLKMGRSDAAEARVAEAESIFRQTMPVAHSNFELVQTVRLLVRRAAGTGQDAARLQKAARERFYMLSGGTLPEDPLVFF